MPIPSAAVSTATEGASKAAGAASKAAGAANIASAAGDVGAAVIGAISTINDVNKRRKFEQNFAQLNLEQQKGLDLKMLEAKSQAERLSILGEYLTQLNSQRIANLANYYSDKEKNKRTNLLIIAGGVGLLGLILAIVLIKRK